MEINISMLLLLFFIFLLIGAVLMLLLQYYVYMKFSLLPDESKEQKDINVKYSLPASLNESAQKLCKSTKLATNILNLNTCKDINSIDSNVIKDTTASLMAINFVLQFLFHELKNSNGVRKWVYRKLSIELDELLAKTTTGKLFDKLTIKVLELGDQFPEIKSLKVHSVELSELGSRIENLDLLLEIQYKGNFRTSIDADMVLGKKASLTLTVKQLSGLGRLQFTRKPYTHWSLSFLGDPALELNIESKYQGRQMQSNVTSLISNQIRKAVRRKHTLPNYKLRYKPFFYQMPDEELNDGDIIPNGQLIVKILEISRLMCPNHLNDIYCTLTMASLSFIEIYQHDDRHVLVSLDVEIHKAKNQQIGIIFKQITDDKVAIETVLLNTPAYKSNLKSNDILVAIQGKNIFTIQQVAKIMKNTNCNIFVLRIERIITGIVRNDAILEDLDIYEDFNEFGLNTNGNETNQTLLKQVTLRTIEKSTSSESSITNTPSNSPKKTRLITKALRKTISRDHDRDLIKYDENRKRTKSLYKLNRYLNKLPINNPIQVNNVKDVEHYFQHSTVDCILAPIILMEDECQFKLDTNCRFLNVCVYGKCSTENRLLGFTNISIAQILTECCETSLSQCFKTYKLNPPLPNDLKSHPLSFQMGFNSNLCFGDIVIAFSWDGNPNIPVTVDTPSKQNNKLKTKVVTSPDRTDDSGCMDGVSLKLFDSTVMQAKTHNFIRTHFHRATQCDFCGKKIWLKDAVKCRECSMCCHKKCINKCQNATVCGPVECFTSLQQTIHNTTAQNPDFMVTEPKTIENIQFNDNFKSSTMSNTNIKNANNENNTSSIISVSMPNSLSSLDSHTIRTNFPDILNKDIKRVNSTNNLAIPGLIGTVNTGTISSHPVNSGTITTNIAKSLPPTPQHSTTPSSTLLQSRKQSIVMSTQNPFDIIIQYLIDLPNNITEFSAEQVAIITKPILLLNEQENDAMTLAKNSSKFLFSELTDNLRADKINNLLTKIRLAFSSETARYAVLEESTSTSRKLIDTNETITTTTDNELIVLDAATAELVKIEERLQALNVIMLYLCTGLQYVQGIMTQ